MKPMIAAAALLAALLATAQAAIALDRAGPRTVDRLEVSSPAFRPGGAIPKTNSAYGANRQPAIAWRGKAHAASFALIVEDPDAKGPAPFVHWVVFDIPGTSLALTDTASAGTAGGNGKGAQGWWGPHPPAGTGVHHYHFQLFALDKRLGLPPGADRDAVVAAMAGHVVARGELVGTYAAP